MSRITPCLWFDGHAQEAAELYTSLLPDSRIDGVTRSPADNPSTPKDAVLTVEFTLSGQPFVALNGGPDFPFTEAVSFMIDCEDQADVDRLWDALVEGGGSPGPCGWLKDPFGVSWQIVPSVLPRLLASGDRDAAERTMKAMLGMGKLDIDQLLMAYDGSAA